MRLAKTIASVMLICLFNLLLGLTVVGENGSIVYYNGKLVGVIKNGSITFEATFPGILKVTKPGYVDFEKEVTEDGVVVAELMFPAYLSISAMPVESKIYLDGVLVGVGHVKVSTRPGTHRIIVGMEGYTEWIGEVTLAPFEERELKVNLKRTTTLKLISETPIEGALLNGERISIPGTYEVTPGAHKLELPANYVVNKITFEVPSTSEYAYRVDSRRLFKLSVMGKPERATVQVGGFTYTAPVEIFLPEGNYDVLVSAQGYSPRTYSVKLMRDEYLIYTLEPLNEISGSRSLSNFVVEYDGFTREKVVRKLWFTTIKDTVGGIVWFGFSDGVLRNLPSTVPIAFSRDFQLRVGGYTFKGPGIIQVVPGTQIECVSMDGYQMLTVKNLTILDSSDKVLVNVLSQTSLDVYVDGKFVGRTPIYLLELPEGIHQFEFKSGTVLIEERLVTVSRGKLNEVKSEK